jgi:hypothetical protein
MNTIWIILAVISILLLIKYFKTKNAVWGGFSIGAIIGLIVAVIVFLIGNGFKWSLIGKIAVVGTLIGFGSELLTKISYHLKRRNSK